MSLLRRKKFVVNQPDPIYNVTYLGNVATIMAKGDACYEKPLALIWKAYNTRTRPDVPMQLMVTRQGLKAFTKQQGITEYFAPRITYCAAPSHYGKVFVWIYRHDGKKMKPEVRCHAALCKKNSIPEELAKKLTENIAAALSEYRREKISRENVRLYGGGLMPLRKEILSTGIQNFRPPTRSKSAPKLGAIEECVIEEALEEEEEDDIGEAITPLQSSSEESSPEPDRASLMSDLYISASPNPDDSGSLRKISLQAFRRGDSIVSTDSDFASSSSCGSSSCSPDDTPTSPSSCEFTLTTSNDSGSIRLGVVDSGEAVCPTPPIPIFPTSIEISPGSRPTPPASGSIVESYDNVYKRVRNLTLLQLGHAQAGSGVEPDPDAVSDESGYHEDKLDGSHYSELTGQDSDPEVIITYL